MALVTCTDERYQEPEVHVAAAALRATGVSTDVVSWDEDRDWGAYELVVVRTLGLPPVRVRDSSTGPPGWSG